MHSYIKNKRKNRKNIKKPLYLIVLLVFLLGLIHFFNQVNCVFFFTFEHLPTINEFLLFVVQHFTSYEFLLNVLVSISRVISGFLISVCLAIPLAFLTYRTSLFRKFIYPILELLRPIPNAAWIPISILLFTSVNNSVVFIIVMSSFFPIYVNTLNGLEEININYIKTALSLNVSSLSCIFEILLPASAPSIFVGISLGMSGAWLGLVVAEMISGKSGIGYMLWINYTLINFSGVIFYMIVIGFLGALSTFTLKTIFKKMIKWKKQNVR